MSRQLSKKISLEQQPTQPIAMELRNIERQATQPMSRRRYRSMGILRWFIPVIVCLFLVIGVILGRTGISSHLHTLLVSHGVIASGTHKHKALAVSLTDQVANSFMDAMMHKDWPLLWSMLHPDEQRSWQNEQDFIHFEQAKFGSLKFIANKISPSTMQQNWRNPDTTQIYPSVATLTISLQATAPQGMLSAPSNSALNAGLFNNTLFALAQSEGKWKVLVAGPADQDAPILVPTKPQAVKVLVPIFMYHHVSNLPTANLLDYNLTVTATDFEEQLNWLQQQGYQSINQAELFDTLYYGKALPAHPMILSFDDGYEDVYTNALPALLAHHYRGVFYIITGMIGGRYMTWDQVRTLARDGMQVSSHTIHHVNVGEPPAWTSTQAELTQSKQTLESQLHQPIQFFCYPSGEPFHHDTVAEQQMVLAILFKDGYVGATLDPLGLNSAIQDVQTPYELTRIRVSGGEGLNSYIGILNYTLQVGSQELGLK